MCAAKIEAWGRRIGIGPTGSMMCRTPRLGCGPGAVPARLGLPAVLSRAGRRNGVPAY